MPNTVEPLYGPALRLKAGELTGLGDLAPDVADRVLPRLVVPPRAERDDDLQRHLFTVDGIPAIGASLAGFWLNRPVLIEVTYLIDDFGADTSEVWLPKMIEMARKSGVQATPLVSLRDLRDLIPSLRLAATFQGELQLAIRIPFDEMVSPGWRGSLTAALNAIGVRAENCGVVADFCNAEFAVADAVSGVIQGTLEDLQEVGRWRHIVFQGTNFPEKNPAVHGGRHLVERNEWHAWRQAVKFDPTTADHLIFGDYAADCSKFSFGSSGARPIPHYRYATENHWLIQRGGEKGSLQQVMKDVCSKIVGSGQFAGRSFSAADDYIFLTAKGLTGPGNSTTWRAVNTCHHITRVVTDVGAVRNIAFALRPVEEVGEQQPLFES